MCTMLPSICKVLLFVDRQNVNSHLESHTQVDELGLKPRLGNRTSNFDFFFVK